MPASQLETVEGNLHRLNKRLPQLPVTESLILRAAVILGRDTNVLIDRILEPAGLCEGEFRLLMSLMAHDGRGYAGDLGAAMGQSPANLTRLADSMVERGYLSREPDELDRRRMLLQLLPEGERLLHSMIPGVCREVTALFAGVSEAEKVQMLDGFKRLLTRIDAQESGSAGREP